MTDHEPVNGQAGFGLDLAQPDEFRLFYLEQVDRVYGYFLHRCGGRRTVAEDLTQETFTSAVTQLRSGTRVAAPAAWLRAIARHKLLDHYRREGAQRRRLSALTRARTDSVEWEDDAAARAAARTCLAAVPATQRAALVLRYLDDLSVPDVAAQLGVSVHAAESLLARGRHSFRRIYTEGQR